MNYKSCLPWFKHKIISIYSMTVYIVAHKKYDQNDSMATYLVLLFTDRSCTNSDKNMLKNMDLNF